MGRGPKALCYLPATNPAPFRPETFHSDPRAAMTFVIENEIARLVLQPSNGARVVSMIDKRSGREWLVQGNTAGNPAEDAIFDGSVAAGWDECFPTVGICDAKGTGWARNLRDHGDLWGRPWQVTGQNATGVTTRCDRREFAFERRLVLDQATINATYAVTNKTAVSLPYLWAVHPLLQVRTGDQITLPGVTSLCKTYVKGHDTLPDTAAVDWPTHRFGFPLDQVQGDCDFAAKLYARATAARVGTATSWLNVDWDSDTGALGLWLTYGGWPDTDPVNHIAIEPTTAQADDLLAAIRLGSAKILPPGATHRWQISMSLGNEGRA
jgi:hypothetical protein